MSDLKFYLCILEKRDGYEEYHNIVNEIELENLISITEYEVVSSELEFEVIEACFIVNDELYIEIDEIINLDEKYIIKNEDELYDFF